jgi:hypothetical protein
MTAAWPLARFYSMAFNNVGHFIEVMRWLKNRCLLPSKAERAADLALRFLTLPVGLVMLVAYNAASRF